jgi:competence protein ComEC
MSSSMAMAGSIWAVTKADHMSRSIAPSVWLVAWLLAPVGTAWAQPGSLNIYWVDVEGGAATLIVGPSGESVLFDSGWEVGDRDAKRIFAVARQAGLREIDSFVLSHFHADHAGGIAALAKMLPIGRCFDRGDFIEPANQRWRDAYLSVCAGKRTILHAGDKIPLRGVQVDVVASQIHVPRSGRPRLGTRNRDGMPR